MQKIALEDDFSFELTFDGEIFSKMFAEVLSKMFADKILAAEVYAD